MRGQSWSLFPSFPCVVEAGYGAYEEVVELNKPINLMIGDSHAILK